MLKRLAIVFGLLLVPTLAPAAEIWNTKPVGEWTLEQTQKFFWDSPWVQKITIGGTMVGNPLEQHAAGGREGTQATGDEAWRGGATYHLEWSSAKILRQAGMHIKALRGGMKEDETEPAPLKTYLVTVSGPDMRVFEGLSEDEIKAAAYLRPKRSKAKTDAVAVKIWKSPEGRVAGVQYAFPREAGGQPVISDQEKAVEFRTKARDLTLQTSFDVNKMVGLQGRDL